MEYIDNIPVFSLEIDGNDDLGVSCISLVDSPANNINFIKMSKQSKLMLSINDDKRLITGVQLRANYPIYRNQNGKEFYFIISPDQISLIMQKFMKDQKTNKVNMFHDDRLNKDGVYMVESYLLNENHRLTYPEFSDIENGSWMGTYKIDNDDVWKDIKEGKVLGFSPEITGILYEIEEEFAEIDYLLMSLI